jgi:recombination protein RecT
MSIVKSESRSLTPLGALQQSLKQYLPEFQKQLPSNVDPEKFLRIVLNTVAMNPAFLKCDKASLFAAAAKCAGDGLFPDGREAAMIPYGNQCQYQIMIYGVYKKARNSGEIALLCAEIVYPGDHFKFGVSSERGKYLDHQPKFDSERDVKDAIAVYALSKTKDGECDFEVMTRQEIEHVRNKFSKAAKGPAWTDSWGEMARKTVVKKLAKRLPASSDDKNDLRKMLDKEDENYDASLSVPKSKAEEFTEKFSNMSSVSDAEIVGEQVNEVELEDVKHEPGSFGAFQGTTIESNNGKVISPN